MKNERNKQLAKDFAIYGIGNIACRFLMSILFPFLTFFTLVDEFGYYDISFEAILFLLPITTLQMRESTFRLLIDATDDAYRKHIISTTLFIEGVVFAFLLVVAALLPSFFSIRYFYLIALSVFTYSIYEICNQAVRSVYSSTQFVLMNIITSFFTVALVILLYFVFKRNIIETLFIANILSRISAILIIELPRRKIFGIFSFRYVKRKYMKEILNYSMPLVLTSMAFGIITSCGKFIVNYLYGNAYSGILGAANKYMIILLALGMSFYQAWQVTAVKNFKERGSEKYFSEVFNKYAVVICLLVIIISFGLRSFKTYLIGAEFYQSIELIYIYCAGALFYCFTVFFEVTYLCAKKTSKILYSNISCAIVTPPLAFALTKYYGLIGSLTALTIAYAYLFIFRYFQTKPMLPIRLGKEFYLSFIGLAAGGVLFYCTQNQMIDYTILFVTLLLLSYFIYLSRNYFTRNNENDTIYLH